MGRHGYKQALSRTRTRTHEPCKLKVNMLSSLIEECLDSRVTTAAATVLQRPFGFIFFGFPMIFVPQKTKRILFVCARFRSSMNENKRPLKLWDDRKKNLELHSVKPLTNKANYTFPPVKQSDEFIF